MLFNILKQISNNNNMKASDSVKYTTAKLLEYHVLEYLNRVQPFRFYNTITNEILPISPYKPSVYKYTTFDFYNDYIILDLKKYHY